MTKKMQGFSDALAGLTLRQLWKVALGELPYRKLDVNDEHDAYIIESAKHKLRRRNKDTKGNAFQNTGDTCRFRLVTDCKTIEEAKAMFAREYETHFVHSPYDCTGSIETSLETVWKRPIDGKVCMYYGMAMDV